MSMQKPPDEERLIMNLDFLNMPYIREHYATLAEQAAKRQATFVHYLCELIEAESESKRDRSAQRRVKLANFPVIKTLADFDWNWPTRINQDQIKDLFRLSFLPENKNIIFLGGVGVGKSHLSIALGYTACMRRHSVLFTTAMDIVNTLRAAQKLGQQKQVLRKYAKPKLLIIDELGYLPIDKFGADGLFQVVSQRYEKGSIILTTNKPFKKWPELFGNDSILASAVLDRLLHHAENVVIQGKSYRMKDRSK